MFEKCMYFNSGESICYLREGPCPCGGVFIPKKCPEFWLDFAQDQEAEES